MVGQIYRTRMRQDAPDWKPGQFLAVSVFLGAVLASHNLFAADESQPEHEPSRSQVLEARRKEKAEHLEPYEVTAVEEKIGNYEKRPWFSKLTVKGFRGLRLELGGLSRESGFAFGAGYLAGADRPVNIHARALYSTTGDSQVDTRLGFFESDESRFSLNLKACSSDLNQLTFYGIGPESEPDSKQDFGLSSRILSFETRYEFMPHLELKAGIGQADFRPTALPNSPETLAEASRPADYWIQGYGLTARFLDNAYPKAGVEANLRVDRYSTVSGKPSNFTRFSAEMATQIPLGSRVRRLAVGAVAAFTAPDAGHTVPFYLLEKLGGSRSLRGFPEHRFQDLNRLLLNIEYRWEVWTYMDFVVFSDFGKVFHKAADFDLSDLRKSAGFGVFLHTPAGLRLRFDVARSAEGFQFHVGVGPLP